MSESLPPGLYDQVLTEGLEKLLNKIDTLLASTPNLDPGDSHLFLSQHLYLLLQSALQGLPHHGRISLAVPEYHPP